MPEQHTRLDYKPQTSRRAALPRRWHLAAGGSALLLLAALAGLAAGGSQPLTDTTQHLSLSLPTPAAAAEIPATPQTANQTITLTVASGDTLAGLFDAHALQRSDLHAMMQLPATAPLKTLQPGEVITVTAAPDGRVQNLHYVLDKFHELRVSQQTEGFTAAVVELPLQRRIAMAQGTIDSSLFLAGMQAGLSDNVTMNLANIFGWDIDFVQDLRPGDTFSLIYEELYRNGEKLGDGDILAAEFVNQGETFRAVRYTDPLGVADYYTPDGKSVRKTLLRTPVDFTRISSNFSMGRKHPILNRVRRHEGTDYAAPTGTPIRAAGNGKIVFRGKRGGYGNMIIIEHGGGFSTAYGHMSRFARGQRTGSRVKQGQTIGYVGMTGLATGPHLHYEVRLNGTPRNPRTVKLPDAKPIDPLYKADFLATTAPLLRQLDLTHGSPALLAAANK